MERLIVKGGNRLVGRVKTSGAKNAVLPIIAASILGTSPSRLDEIPALEDVRTICAVLECLGIKARKLLRVKRRMSWCAPCVRRSL